MPVLDGLLLKLRTHTSLFVCFFLSAYLFFWYWRKDFCDTFLPLSFIWHCSNVFILFEVYFIWDIYYKCNQINHCFVFFFFLLLLLNAIGIKKQSIMSIYNYLKTVISNFLFLRLLLLISQQWVIWQMAFSNWTRWADASDYFLLVLKKKKKSGISCSCRQYLIPFFKADNMMVWPALNKTHCCHSVQSSFSIMESITTTDLAMTVQPTIFPRVGYSILSYLMFINTLLSVFNNLLVIAVMLKNVRFLNAMNVIILSLAVSDLMIATCGSAIVTITNYEGSFFLGDAFCVFQGFAVNYFGKCWLKG